MSTRLFSLFSGLGVCVSSFAQHTTYQFDNYSSKDGLPSSEVHSVIRDRDDYLWFATDHGVCRYDGYSFQKIPLPDNTVFYIRQDDKGRIWFATYTAQLFYFEKEKVFPYWYNNVILAKFRNEIITDFHVHTDSTLYISFNSTGPVTIDANGRSEKRLSDKSSISIQQVDSAVFFTTILNPSQYMPSPAEIEINCADYHSRVPLPINNLWATKHRAILSSDGGVIAYAMNYLISANNKDRTVVQQLPYALLSLFEDRDGDLWVGGMKGGVIRMTKEHGIYVVRDKHLEGFSITEIAQDHEGGLWFTSKEKGVFYLRSKYLHFLSPSGKALNYRISSVATLDDSLLVIGTEGYGLHFYESRNKEFTSEDLTGNFDNICYDPQLKQVLVLGSGFGDASSVKAVRRNYLGYTFFMSEGNSNCISWSDNHYLFGRHSGAFTLDKDTGVIALLNEKVFRVSWLLKDRMDNVLVANQYGLWRFKQNKFYPYDSTSPLLSKRITCMQLYQDSNLCLGTRGEGLMIKTAKTIHRITEEQGLVNNNIRRILVTGNTILIATNKGLSRITIRRLDPLDYSIHNLGVAEGLFVSEINDITRLNDQLYIASDIGVAVVDERQVLTSAGDRYLPFHFTGITINDRTVDWQPKYLLNYRQKDITIAYTALSFRNSPDILYRYRIREMDTNWVYTSAREIRLTSMPYGDFTIEFQAGSRQGKWTSATRSLHFSIQPPFWQRTWFLLLCAVILGGLLYWWTKKKISGIRKREKEKTHYNKLMAEMEIRALRAQMNPHFTFNVMQSIQYYITHHDFDSAQRYLGKFSKLMRRVLDNSRFAYISLFDEIEMLRDYLDLEKLRFENEFEYIIHTQAGFDPHMIEIPTMLIQPYVENAVKHGLYSQKNNPAIKILIHLKNEYLIVEIIDNGVGRTKAAELAALKDQKHVSAGTLLVAERIEAFNKYYGFGLRSEIFDLYNEQTEAIGTRVVLTIPIYHNYDKSTTG